MNYNLVKKVVEKGEKKYINFYLQDKDRNVLIPIEIKAYKEKNGDIDKTSKFNFQLAYKTSDNLGK